MPDFLEESKPFWFEKIHPFWQKFYLSLSLVVILLIYSICIWLVFAEKLYQLTEISQEDFFVRNNVETLKYYGMQNIEKAMSKFDNTV